MNIRYIIVGSMLMLLVTGCGHMGSGIHPELVPEVYLDRDELYFLHPQLLLEPNRMIHQPIPPELTPQHVTNHGVLARG